MKLTGSPIVDELIDYNPPSIAIPHAWFKTIANDKGKPNINAIIVLSEIVYWYRPSLIKDEMTGEFLGYKKRFKDDLLQKNRRGFEKTFGLTKDQTYTALKHLENLGVIKNHLRHVETKTTTLNNVRYIELIPEKLKELTYPIVQKRDPIVQKREGVAQERDPYRIETRPLSYRNETNTLITNTKTSDTEITTREKRDSLLKTVVSHYQDVFGNTPPLVIDAIQKFIDKGFEALVITKAIDLALEKGRKWNYAAGILQTLENEHGVKTLVDYEQLVERKKQRTKSKQQASQRQVPDWVEGERKKQQEHDERKKRELESDVPEDNELIELLQSLKQG